MLLLDGQQPHALRFAEILLACRELAADNGQLLLVDLELLLEYLDLFEQRELFLLEASDGSLQRRDLKVKRADLVLELVNPDAEALILLAQAVILLTEPFLLAEDVLELVLEFNDPSL